ncbi:FAD-dependent monooxygenase [Mycolicibacterium vaccae]|uniref:FAD-dependent monooxygenase n=1 Tax=Mycolicibacterium vaccae TaxID=1810 RepID=UPI003CEFEB6D
MCSLRHHVTVAISNTYVSYRIRSQLMPSRRAVISGAGIAGPVAAFWLSSAGWEVTVVERAQRFRPDGYPVDVRGTASEVLRRMGVYDAVSAQRYRHVPLDVLAPSGRRLYTVDFGNAFSSSGNRDVEIARGSLAEILLQADAGRVDYVFGDSITAVTQSGRGVDIEFARSPSRKADVLIGADGIHSNVRALTFGAEAGFVHHLGSYVAVWDLTSEMFPPGSGVLYSHAGRTLVLERPAGGVATRVFLTFHDPGSDIRDVHDAEQVHAVLRTAFAQDRWQTLRIVDTLPEAANVYFDAVSQVRMASWSRGRVAVVGDAAYAPAFLSGQGTSLAIAGAYVLAGELARHARPETAFAAYRHRMAGYVARNQRLALRDSAVLCRNEIQLWRRNAILRSVPWLQRLGLMHAVQRPLRAAANDLTLSTPDPRR